MGESRQAFQDSLEKYLRGVCANWGISLNSVLIRDILAPQQIAGIIRDRELANQESLKFGQQIVQARSQADLEREKALAIQNSAKVTAETERIRQTIAAEQARIEQTLAARTELSVAEIRLEAARADAAALLQLAEAERRVIGAQNQSAADVLKQQVAVYRDEADYVRAKLYEKTAPNIQSVLTSDTGSGLFGLPVGAKPRLTVPGSLPPATGTAATRPAPAAPKGVTP